MHWVLFNIPPTTTEITDDIPSGSIEGKNTTGENGWISPCPPTGTHRYYFKVYALDTLLVLNASATKADVLKEMNGHILDQAMHMGLYARKAK